MEVIVALETFWFINLCPASKELQEHLWCEGQQAVESVKIRIWLGGKKLPDLFFKWKESWIFPSYYL